MADFTVRDGDPDSDAAACAAIYGPWVSGSAVSFEEKPPSAVEVAARMRSAHAWLVAEDGGVPFGYAYGTEHRARAAYRWAADVAVYVDAGRHRSGAGRELYSRLFERLRDLGIQTVCAGVTLPNPASDGLHAAMGFEPVGTYRRIGWKNGAWHDVSWWQLQLRPGDPGPPGEPGRRAER